MSLNQIGFTTLLAGVPSTLAMIVVILTLWHWLESGSGVTTGFKMSWQDVKVTFSCRSVSTTTRFVTRKYEDYESDRPIFAAPGWKHFICPIYATAAVRNTEYRERLKAASYADLPAAAQTRLDDWLTAQAKTLSNWY